MEHDRNELLRTHTQHINASEDIYAYGHVMRRVFLLVSHGDQLGLPGSDVVIIRSKENSKQSDKSAKTREAMATKPGTTQA